MTGREVGMEGVRGRLSCIVKGRLSCIGGIRGRVGAIGEGI